MGEGTTPSGWRDIDRRHRAGILLGAAGVLVVVVAGVALIGGEPAGDSGGETTRTITPAEQTAEPTLPIPSYEPTPAGSAESPGATGSGTAELPGADDDVLPTSTRVAYRREGWLCVAAFDGSDEVRVAESGSDVFSLSPDGRTIASVDADGHLRLYDIATGDALDLGPMERDTPAWSPDSESVVYTAPGPTVRRYPRRGGRQTILFDGRAPVFTRDGSTVVAVSPASQDPAVLLWCDDRLERRAVDAPVTSVACSATRIYVGTAPTVGGAATLRSIPLSGSGERIEVSSVGGVSIGSLVMSPDGSWLAYAEQGDDHSSRVYAIPADGGAVVRISGRRDAYPLQWAGADTLLLIEGNATQGEPTSLVSAVVTSGVRKLIVEGASG